MSIVRRTLSILLLAFFALPTFAPLLAMSGTSESNLPACCRRNGHHHCAMSAEERGKLVTDAPQYQAPLETCPYHRESLLTPHAQQFAITTGSVVFAQRSDLQLKVGEAEAIARISAHRAHQKRGPPFA
jgi:hypothetical protein